MSVIPPPIIDSARVIYFAENDSDIEYTDRIELHVGSAENEFERIGELPNLAISKTYNELNEILLMFCDEDWGTKGVIAFTTVEEAKIKAERGYKGITEKWQESTCTENEIDDFLRDEYDVDPKSEWWTSICYFCGKNDYELESVLKGKYASICKNCVINFHQLFNEHA